MKKSLKKFTAKELASLIGSHLKKHGITAILTGGSCVTIYSDNRYQSMDLDFVSEQTAFMQKTIKKVMLEIGFRIKKEGFFANPECPYIIEFLPPPLAIGGEPVNNVITLKTEYGSFQILSPTDCVKDRLAAFYHWDDPQSLEQAIMVTRKHKIDFKEIRRWSKNERQLSKYRSFLEKFNLKAG